MNNNETRFVLTIAPPVSEQPHIQKKEVRHMLTLATPVAMGSGTGTENYNDLRNKPMINGVVLQGNTSLAALGIQQYQLPVASGNTLGGIKVGDGLAIDANGRLYVISAPTGEIEWADIIDHPTTIAGYGITDAATREEIEDLISVMTTPYRYKGVVATVSDLENIESPENGDIYRVEAEDADYVWTESSSSWEKLGSFIHIESLTNEDIDAIIASHE